MSHTEQRAWCGHVKELYPSYFMPGNRVLDCGSLDINGNNRWLFEEPEYTGIDICPGPNVDRVVAVHEWKDATYFYDVIISTEMLEHDEHYQASLRAMAKMLRPGGLLIFTCATTGRPEHGTSRTSPTDSPATLDYYRNLTTEDIKAIPGFLEYFDPYQLAIQEDHKDLCFWGIKELDEELSSTNN